MQKRLLAVALLALVLAGCAQGPPEATGTSSTTDREVGVGHTRPLDGTPSSPPPPPPSARPGGTSIRGVVVDEAVRPLVANVTLVERNQTQQTVGGVFQFDRLPPGAYTLLVRATGYQTQALVASTEEDTSVRVQMVSVRGTRAHNTTLHFRGIIECAMEALIITPSCDTVLADPRIGGPSLFRANFSALLPVDPYWRTVVADVAFDPDASPLLDGLRVTARGSRNSSALADYEQHGRFSGAGPFQFRLEPGGEYPDGTSPVPLDTTVFKMDVYAQGHGYHAACAPPGEGGTCFLGVGAGQDVQFDLFLTVFYVDPAPEGFTLLA